MCQIGSQQPVYKDYLYDSLSFQVEFESGKKQDWCIQVLAKKFLINYNLDRKTQILIPK